MAFILFALYLVVSILIGDPVRPFRMFSATGTEDPAAEADRIMDVLTAPGVSDRHVRLLRIRLEKILSSRTGCPDLEKIDTRYRAWLAERERGSS